MKAINSNIKKQQKKVHREGEMEESFVKAIQ